MSISEELAKSNRMANAIDVDINTLSVSATDRFRVSAALLDQALEHHHSIRLLLPNNGIGSAFALIRVIFETTVRGIWLHRCATDEQIEQFRLDKVKVNFSEIVSAVETFFQRPDGALSSIKKDLWESMCSFAHGGYLQAVRRVTDEYITPNYTEAEQIEALLFANFCLVLAAAEIFSMAGNNDLAVQTTDRFFSHTQPVT